MSVLVKWNAGARNATSVVGVTSEDNKWVALMNYLTANGVAFTEAEFRPTSPGLYCSQQSDGSYSICQAVLTPDWSPDLGPTPIYMSEVAFLCWVLLPA